MFTLSNRPTTPKTGPLLRSGIQGLMITASALMPLAAEAAWRRTAPETFESYLAKEYVTAAGFEEKNPTDMPDGTVMRERAVAVQQGNKVWPLLPSEVRTVRSSAEALAAQRARLMRVLESPSKVADYPRQVAQAQVSYDCWALHQQAEPNASHNLYQCERRFQQLIAQLDPPVAEVTPVPVAADIAMYDVIIREDIYFEWDKATLTPKAKMQLDKLHAALREADQPTKKLALQGFADRSGKESYNQKLSERRVKAVADYLEVDPADTVHINLSAYGETNLPTPTADGVREAANRVTKVAIVKEKAQE